MSKAYYLLIGKDTIEVTEAVYYAYKRPVWREAKRRKVRNAFETSLNALLNYGFEAVSQDALIDEIIAGIFLYEQLFSALVELSEDERALIDALYFYDKSERQFSIESGIPRPTIYSRKKSILRKLKSMLEKS